MSLLGIDIGTTHLKAGLFALDGQALYITARPNPVHHDWAGIAGYDPEALWGGVMSLLVEIRDFQASSRSAAEPVQAIGVASMAETGLLVDAATGVARTPLIPWFETAALEQTEAYRRQADLVQVFLHTGLHPAYKYSLMKLLWIKHRYPELLPGGVWLSAADYVVWRLCGVRRTDYTLAERTCAFRVDKKDWDIEALVGLGLPGGLFPPVAPSGEPAGSLLPEHETQGLSPGVPVAVAGHDHVCGAFAAALAAGGLDEAAVFDSMGTAEALIGTFPERPLTEADYHAGFAFGLACAPGYLYWQGGLSTSGGSLEWLRGILGDPALSYAALDALLDDTDDAPTGILYYPYLAGSGSPHSDSQARGAFLGLSAAHTRADLYRAVLEGCAYEMAYQRRRAEQATGAPVGRIVAAGGGTRNRRWMQIKADVFGCPVDVLEQEETTLLGAALLAGIGAGVYADAAAARQLKGLKTRRFTPDADRSHLYGRFFETGYLKYEELIHQIHLHDVRSGRQI